MLRLSTFLRTPKSASICGHFFFITTRTARTALRALTVLATLAMPATAFAAESDSPGPISGSRDPFDKHLAFAGYGAGWAGAYPAAGVGGRIRWEYPHVFGVEGFAEHYAVEWQGGFRHDHPIGFSIYKPIQITRSMRIRPLLGACAVFSFIEPEHAGGPRADDIMFGVHAGLGMEIALHEYWSFFVEGQGIAYLAHDRTAQNWTGSVSQGVGTTAVFQPNIGLQAHFL